MKRHIGTMILLCGLIGGCSAGGAASTTSSASASDATSSIGDVTVSADCRAAVETAANNSDTANAVDNLDAAIQACATLDEWKAVTAQFPDVLSGVDAETFLSDRCQTADAIVADSALCQEVGS